MYNEMPYYDTDPDIDRWEMEREYDEWCDRIRWVDELPPVDVYSPEDFFFFNNDDENEI